MKAKDAPKKLTAEALKFDNPVDFDDAMLRVKLLTTAVEIGLEQLEKAGEDIEALKSDLSDAKDEAIAAKEEARNILEAATADLENVHQWIKRGNAAEAIHTLHRLMQEFDTRCTRATVVTPRLPMAGSFAA